MNPRPRSEPSNPTGTISLQIQTPADPLASSTHQRPRAQLEQRIKDLVFAVQAPLLKALTWAGLASWLAFPLRRNGHYPAAKADKHMNPTAESVVTGSCSIIRSVCRHREQGGFGLILVHTFGGGYLPELPGRCAWHTQQTSNGFHHSQVAVVMSDCSYH